MSLTEQRILHNLSVNDKGKLTWNSSYDLLRKFVDEVLNLPNGEWSSPGGDAKLFESEGVSIRWYAKAKTITLNGRCRNDKSLEEHMQSFESRLQALSKEFAANMPTVNNILWEHSNEPKQINNPHPDSELTSLKKENLELKNQNKDLTNRISN